MPFEYVKRLPLTSTLLQSLPPQSSYTNNHKDEDRDDGLVNTPSPSSPWQTITGNPKQSILFSISQTTAGALLGPFLDTYHSVFNVLQYDNPITLQLWSRNEYIPALVTTWWVPYLFGLAGFIIGWLYIILDSVFFDDSSGGADSGNGKNNGPVICLGISFFTFQYWLSGIMYSYGIDRSIILCIMSICAYIGYKKLDDTKSGLITSTATAVGGPLIELGLISLLTESIGGYHYTDIGETGFFPLWIVPVYFLGGPANGNLARGVWDALGKEHSKQTNAIKDEVCTSCNNSRAVPCPNCDGVGYYMTYGREVKCNCCQGRGLVICRNCFSKYGEDPSDIEAIRERMARMPD